VNGAAPDPRRRPPGIREPMDDPTCVSLFSGIGGLDFGLARAGFRHLAFCESDAYRRDVLVRRWPGVPVYEDVRKFPLAHGWCGVEPDDGDGRTRVHFGRDAAGGVDLLCGGFPCQDLSVAGQRRGLDGDRSGLFFEFVRVAESLRPRWLLIENVPGLLSSNGGRDFGTVLGTLADIGYGLAWRVLDSRFFGVPQRRRRVFIVGAVADGDPRAAAERAGQILAVGTRCPRHPATRTEAGSDVAGTLGGGAGERGWAQDTERMTFVAGYTHSGGETYNESEQIGSLTQQSSSDTSAMAPLVVAAPLSHGSNPNSNMAGRRREDDENLVAFNWQTEGDFRPNIGRESPALQVEQTVAMNDGASVRRLMPVECERLQALPDGWTDLGGTADSKRYAALGDAVTATVAEWIGRRLR
jgi:DNA (cytosine-5)-methyltransferase 1